MLYLHEPNEYFVTFTVSESNRPQEMKLLCHKMNKHFSLVRKPINSNHQFDRKVSSVLPRVKGILPAFQTGEGH